MGDKIDNDAKIGKDDNIPNDTMMKCADVKVSVVYIFCSLLHFVVIEKQL